MNSSNNRRWKIVVALLANLTLMTRESAADDAVTADPPVPRPSTTPCVVPLFVELRFADFSPKLFDYAPPGDCPGPWSKVVFEADFYVTAGRQYDRTASVWMGGANIYFGTTQEPASTSSPSWHVERDLTDYAALFTIPQIGEVDLDNLVDSTYTGVIFGSADVQFYPLSESEDPLVTANVVLPLSARATGGTVALQTSDSVLERSFTLPTNIERAYLDVVVQSQSGDEFWYLCVPSDVASQLRACGGTGFREAQIAIDGEPAGVAPIYPWIFTGGIDPYLWRPIPGLQALNFIPYRVDLTPFAGVLNAGKQHSVAVRVYNANHNFATTASLLLYLDQGSSEVTGEVTRNTLTADPTPEVQEDVSTVDGVTTGTVTIRSSRAFAIEGFVNTSHGTVQTDVAQVIDFSNQQDFRISSTSYLQNVNQTTRISSYTSTRDGYVERDTLQRFEWPLTLVRANDSRPDGTTARATTIRQGYRDQQIVTEDGKPLFSRGISSVVAPMDTLILRGTTVIGREGQNSLHAYLTRDSSGACYSRRITTAGGIVTEIVDGQGCAGDPF